MSLRRAPSIPAWSNTAEEGNTMKTKLVNSDGHELPIRWAISIKLSIAMPACQYQLNRKNDLAVIGIPSFMQSRTSGRKLYNEVYLAERN